ncbi:MAG: histidine kinase [Bacteroidota bacterium]
MSVPIRQVPNRRELIFQLCLHLLVLLFYSFDQREPGVNIQKIAFFINYALATLFISYFLLPRFLYAKKYYAFIIGVSLSVVAVILVEEFFLEQIFFPDTRGARFYGIINTMLDVLPVMTMLAGSKFAWDALAKQRQLENLQLAVQESELQFLKSQINPHFLFNNLNNLYSYALEQSPKTPDIILELSAVLRYMLYDCRSDYVLLDKEIEQLKNFTQLNQLQIEDRGTINFSVPKNSSDYQIAPLILIVFIENAFKHSQSSQSDSILIDVKLDLKPSGRLHFSCINSFQTATNQADLPGGIGLENVKKRLDLLYPQAHELSIKQSDDRFSVFLQLQLNKTVG